MEDYAAKMLQKPDAALREYVTGYVQYREAAVLAALAELRRRGQPAAEEATLRPLLEAGAARQQQLDDAAELARQAEENESADPESITAGPSLYSQGTIVMFSIFSMLAGGLLLSMNLGRLGKWRAVLGVVAFLVAYSILGALVLTWMLPRFGIHPLFGPLFNLPAILVYLLWFWPRYIGGTSYRSRSWLLPALVCVMVLLGMQRISSYLIQQQPKEMRQKLEDMMPK